MGSKARSRPMYPSGSALHGRGCGPHRPTHQRGRFAQRALGCVVWFWFLVFMAGGRGWVCGPLPVFCAASCTILRNSPAVAPLSTLRRHSGPSGPCFSRTVGDLSGAGSVQVAQTRAHGALRESFEPVVNVGYAGGGLVPSGKCKCARGVAVARWCSGWLGHRWAVLRSRWATG